jgi:hypothetical protein
VLSRHDGVPRPNSCGADSAVMQRGYTRIRSAALGVDRAVNEHLAQRTAEGWRLEHVTDRCQRGLIGGGYEFSFYWIREDPPAKSIQRS